jgi:small subunit ribosomal protein S13
MARVASANIPDKKRVEIALTYIHGIGLTTSKKILAELDLDPNTRVKDLQEAELVKIRTYIDKNLIVESDLRRDTNANVRRLKEIKSYRGLRHIAKLPVRGQRTKTNARTKRGKKINVGSGRKKSAAKT